MEAIKGLIVIKWEKVTKPPLLILCVVANHVKKFPPTTVCEFKLNYLHIYVHSHHQKNI
jgi:hypothetical protein